METKEKVRSEFDQVALSLTEGGYRDRPAVLQRRKEALKRIPPHCDQVLEIGCGWGDFARYLAGRSSHVLAVDLSPEMIRVAREQNAGFPNIEFQVADAMEYPYPPDTFDLVISFMTFHHLPLEQIMEKARYTLKPGGVLIVFDACTQTGFRNRAIKTIRHWIYTGRKAALRLMGKRNRHKGGRGMQSHAEEEEHPTVEFIRQVSSRVLPGASVKEYYGQDRYTLVWKKPSPTKP